MGRLVAFAGLVSGLLFAAPSFGQPYYARGTFYTAGGIEWGCDGGNLLHDDGLHGDGIAGDGVYATTVVVNRAPGIHAFKIATLDWSQRWPHHPQYPMENARIVTTSVGEAVFFRLDTNARPGWQPETGAVTTDKGTPPGTTLELIGSVPGLGSWSTPLPAVWDGAVWRVTARLSGAGPVEYKFRGKGNWDWPFGRHYNMVIGDNFSFLSPAGPRDVTILFDPRDGRSTVEDATPASLVSWGRLKRPSR